MNKLVETVSPVGSMEAQLSPAPHASRWICGMALTSSTATRPLSFASQRTLAYLALFRHQWQKQLQYPISWQRV